MGVRVESGRALELVGFIATTDRRNHSVDRRNHAVDWRNHTVDRRNHTVDGRNHTVDGRNHTVQRWVAAVERGTSTVEGWDGESIRRNGSNRGRAQFLGRSGADSDGENGGDSEDLHFDWWFKVNLE